MAHRLYSEFKLAVGYDPAFGKSVLAPCTATRAAAAVACIGGSPKLVFLFGFPYYLRVGTDKRVASPFFKLFTRRGIYYGVILPIISYPHIIFPNSD